MKRKKKPLRFRIKKITSPSRVRVFNLDDPSIPRLVLTKRPKFWFKYHLLNFAEASHSNLVTEFAMRPKQLKHLIFIDEALNYLRKGLSDTQKEFLYPFFIRAYSTWLSSVKICLGGQIPETFPVLRTAVETIAMAFHFEKENTSEVMLKWVLRHTLTHKEKKQLGRELGFRTMTDGIDEPLRTLLQFIYDECITLGAHPNAFSLGHGTTDSGHKTHHQFLGAQRDSKELAEILISLGGLAILRVVCAIDRKALKNADPRTIQMVLNAEAFIDKQTKKYSENLYETPDARSLMQEIEEETQKAIMEYRNSLKFVFRKKKRFWIFRTIEEILDFERHQRYMARRGKDGLLDYPFTDLI